MAARQIMWMWIHDMSWMILHSCLNISAKNKSVHYNRPSNNITVILILTSREVVSTRKHTEKRRFFSCGPSPRSDTRDMKVAPVWVSRAKKVITFSRTVMTHLNGQLNLNRKSRKVFLYFHFKKCMYTYKNILVLPFHQITNKQKKI